MTNRFRTILLSVVIPIIVILDQWTKYLVYTDPQFKSFDQKCFKPEEGVYPECGGYEFSSIFDFTMVWNRGISFGIGQSEGIMRWVLFAVTLAIAIGFTIWLFRAARWMTGLALALVVAGAIGNMIDRVRFGAVVDFIDFSDVWFKYVFNVADSAVTVGAALLFLDQFLLAQDEKGGYSVQDLKTSKGSPYG